MHWALFVITAITSGIDEGDYRYDLIDRYETRWACEITKDLFIEKYGPFQENEQVACLRVDE